MGSNRSSFGLLSGSQHASRDDSCTAQYEWQQLTFRQTEYASRKHPQHGDFLVSCLCTSRREGAEDSVTKFSYPSITNYSLSRSGAQVVSNESYTSSSRDLETRGRFTFLYDDPKGHLDQCNPPLDQPGLSPSKQYSCRASPGCAVKRTGSYSASYKNLSKTPKNLTGGPCPSQSYSSLCRNEMGACREGDSLEFTYARQIASKGDAAVYKFGQGNAYLGQSQGNAYLGQSSEQARRSLSPGTGSRRAYRSRGSPPLDPSCNHRTRGTNMYYQVSSAGKTSNTQIRHLHEETYPEHHNNMCYNGPSDLGNYSGGHYFEIDEAKHQLYKDSRWAYNGYEGRSREGLNSTYNLSDCTSSGRLLCMDERGSAYEKEPVYEYIEKSSRYSYNGSYKASRELHFSDHGQIELDSSEAFHDHPDSRSGSNAETSKMLRRKRQKWDGQTTTSGGGSVGSYERGRNCRKRHADQSVGQKVRNNGAYGASYKYHSKRLCYHNQQDQRPAAEVDHDCLDVTRDDNWNGNAESTKQEGRSDKKGYEQTTGAWNGHSKFQIAVASSSPIRCDENSSVLKTPRHDNKTTASSDGPKQSDGSSNSHPQSNKWTCVSDGNRRPRNMMTEEVSRGNLQHPTHPMKNGHRKEPDLSPCEELRGCLDLWRKLKNNRSESNCKDEQNDPKQAVQKTTVSNVGGLLNEKGSACDSLRRDDENDSASKSSKERRSAMLLDGVPKHSKENANKKPQQPLKCTSSSGCTKSSQNMMTKEGLMSNLEPLPLANPVDNVQQKEQDRLSCSEVSSDHADSRTNDMQNGCSDAKKKAEWNGSGWDEQTTNVSTGSREHAQTTIAHPDSSVQQKNPNVVSRHGVTHDHLGARRKDKIETGAEIKKKEELTSPKLNGKKTNALTGPTEQVGKIVACCGSKQKEKTSASKSCNHSSRTVPSGNGPERVDGTMNKHPKNPKKSVKWSSGSNCRPSPQKAKTTGILRNKQESAALANSENNVHHKETNRRSTSSAFQLMPNPMTSFQSSFQSSSDGPSLGVTTHTDQITCLPVSDSQNSSSSMNMANHEFKTPKKMVSQKVADASEALNASKGHLGGSHGSASLDVLPNTAPTALTAHKKEQLKQHEPSQELARKRFGREIPEYVKQLQMCHSQIEPLEQSTIQQTSASIDEASLRAFKCALADFVKEILKPLWEGGILTREVHKIIAMKSVEKVTNTLASNIPQTEIHISEYLSFASEMLYKLVQDYIEIYVGKEVLQKNRPPISEHL